MDIWFRGRASSKPELNVVGPSARRSRGALCDEMGIGAKKERGTRGVRAQSVDDVRALRILENAVWHPQKNDYIFGVESTRQKSNRANNSLKIESNLSVSRVAAPDQ